MGGVEAIGGKMVSLGGMTVLGNSEAVVSTGAFTGGVTVLGQAGAVDDFMSTMRGGITVLGHAGTVDRSALRAGSTEAADPSAPNSAYMENGDPRAGQTTQRFAGTAKLQMEGFLRRLENSSPCQSAAAAERLITAWTSVKTETGLSTKTTASS